MVKVPISKISEDTQVQELLRNFDSNTDGSLESKEVDSDGDGKIDCNHITQNWFYQKLGPVENALFRAGLVAELRNAICRTDFSTPSYNQPYSPKPESPYYSEEVQVQQRLRSASAVDIQQIGSNDSEQFSKQRILLVPDRHGDKGRYDFVVSRLTGGQLDFFAMEMIPHTMQEVVNAYISSDEGSEKFIEAEKSLKDYFTKNWNDKFENEDSAVSPYFHLLEIAREHHVQVIAMDVRLDYYMENPQKDPLVVGTRNLVWANTIPSDPSKRGLVFGGLAHFEWNKGVRVQDFLAERIPQSDMAIVNFN